MIGGKIVSIGYMGDGIFRLTCVGTGCEARDKISVNVKRGYGWDENPWVIALTFRAIQKNIDEVKADG